MRKFIRKALFLAFATFICMFGCNKNIKNVDIPITPVPFHRVELEDDFWYPRLKIQSEVLVPFAFEKTANAVENLRRTGSFLKGMKDELPFAHRYLSSDLYKVMEGASYLLMLDENKSLENKMDSIIQIIGSAQKDDGYIYVAHTVGIPGKYPPWGGAGMGNRPYSFVLHSHELYNMGHMYEAAVAYYQATGKKAWLDIAEKNARHINKVFFKGDESYNGGKPVNQAPGHQEIELGLIKLYRVTGDSLYLNMANRFLEIRGITYKPEGEGVMSPTYSQQHKPVAEQRKPVGHAVRATYMYSAMAEVEALLNLEKYRIAIDRIWQNIVDTRMHITGGLGAVHGIEGFGPEYVLPNASAYNETCASVGNVLFNFRMFLLTGSARYLDVAEIALYNNSLAGVNIGGNRFHYVNPLEFDGETPYNFGKPGRSPWFSTACCPTNIARLIPQVAGMAYTHSGNDIFIGLYIGSSTTISIKESNVFIRQITKYPFEGKVKLEISPETGRFFNLNLRIPTWVGGQFVPGELYKYLNNSDENFSIKVNGKPVKAEIEKGFAKISRKWKKNDIVELSLPMLPRYNTCLDSVEANRNKMAITRGPLVYCAEEIDNGGNVMNYRVIVPDTVNKISENFFTEGILKNIVQVSIPAFNISACKKKNARLKLVPYFAWNNRGQGAMAVWLPQNNPSGVDSIINKIKNEAAIYKVKVSCSAKNKEKLEISSKIPQKNAVPQWVSCLTDKNPWLEIPCDKDNEIQSFSVYWYHNEKDCPVPDDWELEYHSDNRWEPFKIYATDSYSTFKNQYNMVHPSSVLNCSALRLKIKPKTGKAAGIKSIRIDYIN